MCIYPNKTVKINLGHVYRILLLNSCGFNKFQVATNRDFKIVHKVYIYGFQPCTMWRPFKGGNYLRHAHKPVKLIGTHTLRTNIHTHTTHKHTYTRTHIFVYEYTHGQVYVYTDTDIYICCTHEHILVKILEVLCLCMYGFVCLCLCACFASLHVLNVLTCMLRR